ncbi:amino acid adenylation protein [Streptomyces sp. CS227]|uniref:amino acid adenylation domain-containing protein n=1 Tax=Streptomyces sp. CS227 TaxID=1982763 RepID=UPI000B408180|nr:amino acid adenylation domain-containing protein [Streptomyces sp. CS227]OWA02629.1 amino acid adenylation protein [Streptomyces sp. CS227]
MTSVVKSAWLSPTWSDPHELASESASEVDGTFGEDFLLHHGFVEQAARTPRSVAVVSPARSLTYTELDAESGHVACLLADAGTGHGSLVGVVMEKGWEQVVACFGVLRAGAAYVPVDPAWPAKRLSTVIESAGVTTVLTQPWLRGAVDWPATVTVLDVDGSTGGTPDTPSPPHVPVSPNDLAYVIYTSGSTGVPKGVMIEHGSAVNTVRDVNDELSLSAADRVLALSALHFDLSVYDVFGPLSVGGSVVLPEPSDSREPAAWVRLMAHHNVTVWNSVPALMSMLCIHLASETQDADTDVSEIKASALPMLRAVLMSGDWIPVALPGDIRKHFPDASQWSLGGATEASIWSIWHRITAADAALTSVPYGKAMRNQRVYVADSQLRPRPRWVPGEICIAGAGVARGYLGDEERTMKSFVVGPGGERVYRTGDLGRLLPSGEIEFLGREDTQVKIGGHRIELGDVEAALLGCSGVANAVVITEGDRGRTRLVAHVLPAPGTHLTEPDLKRLAGEVLPRYMVPSAISVQDSFPLTSNGKVDRAALAANRRADSSSAENELPKDVEEELLLSVWSRFFDIPALSVTDNYFDLGGDSLQAVRLVSVLRTETGVDIPVSTLFGAPTIRALAQELRHHREAAGKTAGRPPLVPIRRTGTAVPLVFAHPIGGEVLCYAELARLLGDDQPFYALQSPSELSDAPTLQELAAAYAKAILHEVPGERFRLGGWSMGGLLAIETARELTAMNCTVDLVTVIDVIETPEGLRKPIDEAELLNWLGRDLAGLTGRLWQNGDDTTDTRTPTNSSAELFETLRSRDILPTDIGRLEFEDIAARFMSNARALHGYRPARYGGRVHFLRAEYGATPETAGSWQALCHGTFEHHTVPGDHYTVLKSPQVEAVAASLHRILQGAATPI